MKFKMAGIFFFAFAAIVFDSAINFGWSVSAVLLVMGVYWLLKSRTAGAPAGYKVRGAAGIIIFMLTTLIGYGVSWWTERGLIEFAESIGTSYPKNKTELLLNTHFNSLVRMAFISYANVDGHVVIKLREFPYQVMEYDFKSGRFYRRPYD